MDLGTFSLSLTVQDLEASWDFYQSLGFRIIDGNWDQHWLLLENGPTRIGIFENMFEENIMTFNPGDVRNLQKTLKKRDVLLLKEADEDGEGPAYIILKDPDGNAIMLDQSR